MPRPLTPASSPLVSGVRHGSASGGPIATALGTARRDGARSRERRTNSRTILPMVRGDRPSPPTVQEEVRVEDIEGQAASWDGLADS